jgi:hypothetical protein
MARTPRGADEPSPRKLMEDVTYFAFLAVSVTCSSGQTVYPVERFTQFRCLHPLGEVIRDRFAP